MMMLGIESSSLTASAALLSEEGLIGEFTVNFHKTHSETLLPMVDHLFSVAGTDLSRVDAIAVSEGPGSFTGLRIGASTAKGLAFGAGKDVVPVPTLDAMAFGTGISDKLLCPVMDARRNEVYGGIYLDDGEFSVLMPASAMPLERYAEKARALAESLGKGILFLGDGLTVHGSAVQKFLPEAVIAPPTIRFQKAGAVAALGLKLFREGKTVSPEAFTPVYLRMSQAERERMEEGLSVLPAEEQSIEPVNRKIGE